MTQYYFLKYDHEEANNWIVFDVDHAVEVEKFSKFVIASSDTDLFVCTLYDFIPLMYSGLKELWMISGKVSKLNVTVSKLNRFLQLTATWIIALLTYYLQFTH